MTSPTQILEHASRILFFTGKGGVGKTSLSCATAVALARMGKRVLLVSTDPASNLDEVLGIRLSSNPTSVPDAKGLWALNVDPEAAARAYRERVVGPYRGVLPESAITSMEEQLSGACTVEIAAFDEFTRLLGDEGATSEFDHIIFDTAPTGHTLRLLKLPSAWTGFIAQNTTGTSCLGPLSGLQAQRKLYEVSFRNLSNPAITTLFLVSRPEPSALAEADRTRAELAEMGLTNQQLFLNAVFTASNPEDTEARALERRGREAIATMPALLAALPRFEIPLLPFAPLGISSIARVFDANAAPAVPVSETHPNNTKLPGPLSSLFGDIEKMGRGVIMTMGKGGVGKTTVAAAVAVELARLGHQVHLTTTDPAAHVHLAIHGEVPGLRVTRIDPVAETKAYTEEVLAEMGSDLDEKGRALLEEDLRSPCTEEISVFRAFARRVDEGNEGFVVIDTAPTGHTLLLLDAAQAYHREVSRKSTHIPDAVSRLVPHLRDPAFTRILIITLPEATPVHEASRLQDDLRRAGIEPYAWVINQSFRATKTSDPLLVHRGELEERYIIEVRDKLACRSALIPWQSEPPSGTEMLRELAAGVAL